MLNDFIILMYEVFMDTLMAYMVLQYDSIYYRIFSDLGNFPKDF